MDGKSLNITVEKLNKLKEIIPEAFTEDKIDWEKLKAALGDDIEFKNERYVLNWAGKSDAFRVLQSPTTATLVPDKDESVNFDTTENIFIEGENLEVLKVLQKAYFGKIKMIYIDPPYNTGNDNFIYPDKFSETKEEYLSRIGDKDETGYLTREGLFRKNSKDNGHYHSNWLSMMYPRLFLARNLLRDDGVIFVSIDDNEVQNLRLLMNEVFGEENVLAAIANINNPKGRSDDNFFATSHEYLLVACKNVNETKIIGFEPEEKVIKRYNKLDKDGRKYREIDLRKTGDADLRENRQDMFYYFYYNEKNKDLKVFMKQQTLSDYKEIIPLREDGKEGRWRWGFKTAKKDIGKLNSRFMPNRKIWGVFEKDFIDNREHVKATTSWTFKDVNSERGSQQFIELGFDKEVYPKPKPIGTLKRVLELTIHPKEETPIVLDFFAGSGSFAQAVYEYSQEKKQEIKFLLVQLPEELNLNKKEHKAAIELLNKLKRPLNYAEIAKERIRRVINKIKKEQKSKLDFDGNAEKQDLGFKVFKLQDSNFKIWRTQIETEEQLVNQLQQHLEPLDENAKTEYVLYELLLKSGISLTAKIEQKDGFYLVNDNEIALILEKVDKKIIKTVIALKPQKVITIDRLFNNNDRLKTNTALQMKDAGIKFKVV